MNVMEITVRSDYGGGPEHLKLLEKYLDKDKFNIFTACPNQQPYACKYSEYSNNIIFIPYRKFSIYTLLRLRKFCKKNNIQLIHSHGKGAGIYSRLLGFLMNLPVIHTPHGLIDYNFKSFKGSINIFLEKILSRLTNLIINVSKTEQDDAIEKNLYKRKKSLVISNGIDLTRFNNAYDNNKMRQKLGLKEDDFIIGNISRLCRQKRVDDLVNSFKYINIPNKKMIIIGDGEERKKVMNIINENGLDEDIKLLGYRDDIDELLSIIDLYVTTSYKEGLPIAVLEAMACKKAIVGTSVVGNNELIIDHYNGRLCEVGNIRDIANKVNEIHRSNKIKLMGQNSYEIVNDKYSVNFMVEQIAKAYLQINNKR